MKSLERPGESISRRMSVATSLSTLFLALRQVTPRRLAAVATVNTGAEQLVHASSSTHLRDSHIRRSKFAGLRFVNQSGATAELAKGLPHTVGEGGAYPASSIRAAPSDPLSKGKELYVGGRAAVSRPHDNPGCVRLAVEGLANRRDDLVFVRIDELFQCRSVGYVHLLRRDLHYRRLERPKRFLRHD